MGITPIETLNLENFDKIISSKIKVFEALENLIMNDNDIDDKNNENNYETLNNKNVVNKQRNKNLSIPKLDFSNIINNYNRIPLYIQEVNYISNNKENKDYNN